MENDQEADHGSDGSNKLRSITGYKICMYRLLEIDGGLENTMINNSIS